MIYLLRYCGVAPDDRPYIIMAATSLQVVVDHLKHLSKPDLDGVTVTFCEDAVIRWGDDWPTSLAKKFLELHGG